MQNNEDIEFTRELSYYRKKLNEVAKSQGSIIAIEGESGFGKSYLLEAMNALASLPSWGLNSVLVEAQKPIGEFKIGGIQPLQPFTRAMEKLIDKEKNIDPHKRLIKNIGLTTLASIPFIDTVFYAVKEIGKDWRQYQEDLSSKSKNKKISIAAADFFDSISSFASKRPLVIHIDDMHWCDAQSVELLSLLADNIDKMPLIIVFSYTNTQLMRQGSALLSFLDQFKDTDTLEIITLNEYSIAQVSAMARFILDNYRPNIKFEQWLLDNTFGVPGIVAEYLKFFRLNSPFDSAGHLKADFDSSSYLPASVHSAFSNTVSKLTEEERNTLAVCSAEGSEFTALIASELMNNDVLTTIKKLRGLQNKTGIIKSYGAEMRYGVKTTVYRFTQAFYYNFFQKSLEFEEHQALHGHITSVLKQRYDETEDETVRREIAPFLAAHSHESGEEDIEKQMLLATARAAKEYGSMDVVNEVYGNYSNVGKKSQNENSDNEHFDSEDFAFRQIIDSTAKSSEDTNANSDDTESTNGSGLANSNAIFDFYRTRKAIIESYLAGAYEQAVSIAQSSLDNYPAEISAPEKVQLLCLAARALLESGHKDNANNYISQAKQASETADDAISECFLLNTEAVLNAYEGQYKLSNEKLKQAAERSLHLAPELKLLTMANIALVLKEYSPTESEHYFYSVKTLAEQMNFNDFKDDFLKMI